MPLLTPRRAALAAAVVASLAAGGYFAFRETSQTPGAPAGPPAPAALVHVETRPPGILPGGAPPDPDEAEAFRKTQAALVKSEFVLNAALRNPKARELVRGQADAPAWLADRVTAEFAQGSSVLRIGVSGLPARDAAILANAVADAYLRESVQAELQAQQTRLRKLEDAHIELTRALESRRKDLQLLADQAGVPPDRADHRSLLAAMYQERTGLRVELARVRAGEGATREKQLREELAALDERIKSCEQANLDSARAEVARLEAAASSVASEVTRLQINLNSPARITLLALATVPQDEPRD